MIMKEPIRSIKLSCPFGDEYKEVLLSKPFGGGDGWSVHINNYYQGVLLCSNGEWTGHVNDRSSLTIDDIQILGEIIEEKTVN